MHTSEFGLKRLFVIFCTSDACGRVGGVSGWVWVGVGVGGWVISGLAFEMHRQNVQLNADVC